MLAATNGRKRDDRVAEADTTEANQAKPDRFSCRCQGQLASRVPPIDRYHWAKGGRIPRLGGALACRKTSTIWLVVRINKKTGKRCETGSRNSEPSEIPRYGPHKPNTLVRYSATSPKPGWFCLRDRPVRPQTCSSAALERSRATVNRTEAHVRQQGKRPMCGLSSSDARS
jgi:hypothetical protein